MKKTKCIVEYGQQMKNIYQPALWNRAKHIPCYAWLVKANWAVCIALVLVFIAPFPIILLGSPFAYIIGVPLLLSGPLFGIYVLWKWRGDIQGPTSELSQIIRSKKKDLLVKVTIATVLSVVVISTFFPYMIANWPIISGKKAMELHFDARKIGQSCEWYAREHGDKYPRSLADVKNAGYAVENEEAFDYVGTDRISLHDSAVVPILISKPGVVPGPETIVVWNWGGVEMLSGSRLAQAQLQAKLQQIPKK